MPTKTQKTRWANYKLSYRRALNRAQKHGSQLPARHDEEATPTVNRLFYEFWSGAPVLNVQSIRGCLAQIHEDVQSDTPTLVGNRWECMMVPHHGQSGAPMLDAASRIVRLLSKDTSPASARLWTWTSMASPDVTGVASQLLAHRRVWALCSQAGVTDDDTANDSLMQALRLRNFMVHGSRMLHGWIKCFISMTATERLAPKLEVNEDRNLDWIQSSELILQRLENEATSQEERMTAVLFAETTEFQSNQLPRLMSVLARFINKNRFATDDETTTAVGSSIRKYAMNMSEEHFDSYANWLLPSQTEALGHELELELTKAVGWRLIYEPLTAPAEHPKLLRVLSELCSSYLTPRLILQKNYAATVLHGIVAVAVLEAVAGKGSQAKGLISTALKMHVEWFTELLSDRISEAIETILEHSPELADRLRIETATQLTGGERTNNASEDSVQ